MTRNTAAGNAGTPRPRPDVARRGMPLIAVGVAVIAATTDPAGSVELIGLAVAVATFVLWERWVRLPAVVFALGVLVPVVLVQLNGQLEPALFLVSLLAVAVTGWEKSPWQTGVVCVAAIASPLLIVALQPAQNRIAWGLWVIGVAFPALLGRGSYRQNQLSGQLELAQRQLAAQAQAEERRRIARDVHDLVGHGLAAMLLQVTSARHVLRRDATAADEALAAAEEAGRRSMQELRGTLALLRSDDEDGVAPPVPDLAALPTLVDAARQQGLDLAYQCTGDLRAVNSTAGLALYRIAQEALRNASQHAPNARTVVAIAVSSSAVELTVDSVGALVPRTDDGRPHYGVIGMRERAATVGGVLRAAPTQEGWQVCCSVPVIFA